MDLVSVFLGPIHPSLAKLSLQWEARKQVFVPVNGWLYGIRMHSFSYKEFSQAVF